MTPNPRARPLWFVAAMVVVLALASAGAIGAASGERIAIDAELAERIDAAALDAMSRTPAAGMSIAVGRGGEVVFAAGYGFGDLQNRLPADAATVYQIGSISKQFTAAAMVLLDEQGVVDLDDPASDYVALPPAEHGPTVAQLLSHTSGVVDAALGRALERTSDGRGMSMQEALELAVAPGFGHPPGAAFEYANGNYLIAYRIIERTTHVAYADFIADAVIESAGLEGTTMCPTQPPAGWAVGYQPLEGNWQRATRLGRALPLIPSQQANMEIVNSVCSTAPDLVRWAQALRTGAVVTPGHYSLMTAPSELDDGTHVPYGLGLQLRRYGDRRAVAHGGIVGGFVSMLADFPDDDVTVALLVNTLLPEEQAIRLFESVLAAVFDEAPGHWTADGADVSVEGSER